MKSKLSVNVCNYLFIKANSISDADPLAKFHTEIKLDLQACAKPSILLLKKQ